MQENDPLGGNAETATRRMRDLKKESDAVASSITAAFASGVVQGKRFEDVLKGIGLRLSEFGLKLALKPLENAIGGFLGNLSNSTGDAGGAGFGDVFGKLFKFEKGGVVSAPTYFGAGGSLGLMGEAGAEAILPLARGADGALGVRTEGSGRPTSVTVNVTTPDAESFRRSEAQVAAALARAVARGRRAG
jgi:phage-related minor tail protein